MTPSVAPPVAGTTIAVPLGGRRLPGMFTVPPSPAGVVLFAHGSGSGRHSPRNRFVADCLNRRGLATLLADLLDEEEADDPDCVFDIDLLADRLETCADWLAGERRARSLPLGLFGASTGAAAALALAACAPDRVRAVVSRGGRPDLAVRYLAGVAAPTLLIVGGDDDEVLSLNERALAQLRGPRELAVVAGATHLFPEPGALDEVARLAGDWFGRHLSSVPTG